MGLTLLLGVFVLGLAIGLPVAVTLGLSSMAYLLFADIPLVVIPQKMYAGMDSFVLLCIPASAQFSAARRPASPRHRVRPAWPRSRRAAP